MNQLDTSLEELPPEELEDPAQTILEHLGELRLRLSYAGISLIAATTFSFIFAQQLLEFLMQPYANSQASGVATLQTLRPTEGLETYFKVSLLAGVVLAMPFLLFQLWRFMSPALRSHEKRYIYIFIPSALALFGLGLAFAWFVLAPAAIFFLANFMTEIFRTDWTGQDYISFITRLLLWIGIAFQMPIIVYFVARVGLITPKTLRDNWRIAAVAIAVLAAVITPSIDPVTMLLTMAPLAVLYVMSIGLASVGQRQFEAASLTPIDP